MLPTLLSFRVDESDAHVQRVCCESEYVNVDLLEDRAVINFGIRLNIFRYIKDNSTIKKRV